ncbi:MAG: ribosome small subunit-dependent GTPase A [Caldilineaceae bacterium]|nr:ribosome small subunit-dependent GTPase A [Caldilineaceae bacterium]
MANRGKQKTSDRRYQDLLQFEERRGRKPKPKRESANVISGIVIRARGHHYDVQTDPTGDNRVRLCEVRGRLLAEKNIDTLVAVGDYVWVLPDGEERGKIERIEERHSVLSRQRPGINTAAEDVILANPDQALIVFAAADPEPHLRMLDRFLVVAEFNDLPAVICINKVDLAGLDAVRTTFGLYAEMGYPVIYTSVTTGEGVAELHDRLAEQLTVVTGPSGVGKSSLINAIHPVLELQVGELRDFLHKGKHTTRAAQLFRLPFGENTYIADTPGIRELGLYDIDPADLSFYFIEMKEYLHDCHYPGCTHDHEPACAVRAAVEAGKIAAVRYDSYLRLLHGEE